MVKGIHFKFITPIQDKNGKDISELKIPHTEVLKINSELESVFGIGCNIRYFTDLASPDEGDMEINVRYKPIDSDDFRWMKFSD